MSLKAVQQPKRKNANPENVVMQKKQKHKRVRLLQKNVKPANVMQENVEINNFLIFSCFLLSGKEQVTQYTFPSPPLMI